MLGALAKNDQRAAQCKQTGSMYLFDYSGSNPDKTDDGPLRFAYDRPIEVALKHVSVPVWHERSNEIKHAFVSHAGLLRLVQLLQYPPANAEPIVWPFTSIELRFSPEAQIFQEICRIGTKVKVGVTGTKIGDYVHRVGTNVGPWDNIERT